jgi:predicted PurR-regulated permease PerM
LYCQYALNASPLPLLLCDMDTQQVFNNRLRQILLLGIILLLAVMLLKQLYIFLPGFLGAITLYILLRRYFFTLTIAKKWGSGITATLFICATLLLIALPVFFSIQLVANKISLALSNSSDILAKAKLVGSKLEATTGFKLITDDNIKTVQQEAANFIPRIINSSANIVSNFAIMLFVLYFMLVNGRQIEKWLDRSIPLKEENIDLLGNETINMIRANAIGIPVMAIIQGITAMIGFAIFGVKDYGLWGFISGICSMIPVVGTAIIWVPLAAYFFATGQNFNAWGIVLFSAIITTNIDYVARLTILKKMMDIHPLITIFGVIIGITLFGFWGVIFGPLLISYFIILVKIYVNEFDNTSK